MKIIWANQSNKQSKILKIQALLIVTGAACESFFSESLLSANYYYFFINLFIYLLIFH